MRPSESHGARGWPRLACTRRAGFWALALLAGLAITLSAGPAAAGLRYALVVGNNHGAAEAFALEDLQHAEREAAALYQQLVHYASFTPERTVLLRGATRAQIMKAVDRLVQQRKKDRQQLGDVPALFAFFFTGHGLSGRLLTADEPLTGRDLAKIFARLDASLTLGFFDACQAGGLDIETLRGKGITVTPGFNPITELPQEVLNSEGTMWFVSSQPDELSFEDRDLGGLLTHYFIEAFTDAPRDGVGISLDTMWEYARRRTLARAARYNRQQTPAKIVRQLEARAPVVFSFPEQRDVSVLLEAEVEGVFLVAYKDAALIERVIKKKGEPLEVPMFNGKVRIARLEKGGEEVASTEVQLQPGARFVLRPQQMVPKRALGFADAPVVGKGALTDHVLTREEAAADLLVGLGGDWRYLPAEAVGARWAGLLEAQLLYGDWGLALGAGYGRSEKKLSTWGYETNSVLFRAALARSESIGPVRAGVEALAGVSRNHLRYTSGSERVDLGYELAGAAVVGVLLPLGDWSPLVRVRLWWGATEVAGVAAGDRSRKRSFGPGAELGVAVPVW